ncbi:MAG: TonB-dependent receptor, partial [Saprospiraceae bacterium]|nr:TonB-dependent receptor [Saprospiraceae bacterium]
MNNAAEGDPGFSSETAYAFESIFGRVLYNWNYKYYVSASIRRDGSSRFGIDVREGTFWSFGASWRMDQEPFIQGIGWIDALKLRASYGLTGNAEIGNFAWLPLISFTESYDESPGGAPSSVGNSKLSWEENKSFNIGIDFTVFDRVSGIIEYYNRESDNLLLNVPISRTSGFRSATENLGTMKNTGVEITLNADVIRGGDFTWSVGANLAFNNNEITQLDEPFVAGTHDRFFRSEGHEFNEYHVYDWAGVNPDDGRPLFYTDETRTETTSDIGEAERFFIGKSGTPDMIGGFNTQLGWRDFFVDANFTTTWNNWLYDATAWVTQGDGRFTPRSQTQLVLD